MKRSTIWSVVGLALGLSWTSVATADGTPLSQHSLEGRVVSVDSQKRSFQIGTAETKKLVVAPNAHIIRDGLNVPFDELRPGDQVRAMFLSDDASRSHPWEIEARSARGREAPWGVRHDG